MELLFLFLILTLNPIVTAVLERVKPVIIGQTVIITCNLRYEQKPDLRFWKYSASIDRQISTCVNETLSALVTLYPGTGVMVYNDGIDLRVESRVAATATFNLMIQNASTLDSGCYECGHFYRDTGEHFDIPTLVIVVRDDESEAKRHNESDITKSSDDEFTEDPRSERTRRALWVFVGIIVSALLTSIIAVFVVRLRARRATQRQSTELPNKVEAQEPLLPKQEKRLRAEKIHEVLNDLQSEHIRRWCFVGDESSKEISNKKLRALRHVNETLRNCSERKHNDVVCISTKRDIRKIQQILERFIADQMRENSYENAVLFAIFCAASVAGIPDYKNRTEDNMEMDFLTTSETMHHPEYKPLNVKEEHTKAGSYRSVVLEYFFARLLWAEVKGRQNEETISITPLICSRILTYLNFLKDTAQNDEKKQGPPLPPHRNMYEKVASSVADGNDMNALDINFWITLIARMRDDINKEILMYNILMNIIFSSPQELEV
ncbi:uncharacterized protein [Diadema antillarum]|uniref:uncharacterized protein n=1 Tax=Diadema antillarum TaxID=105358 RepID=UPI003A86980F